MIPSELNSSSDDNNDISASNDAGNPALADAMRKVLGIGRKSGKESLVLAKAKVITHSTQIKEVKKGFEIIDSSHNISRAASSSDDNDVKDIKPDATLRKKTKKQFIAAQGRLKPLPTDREKERSLAKIATRGVVQLFNAVKEQQKIIGKKLDEAGPSTTKKEKALKAINKKSFMDVLRSCSDTSKLNSQKEETIKTEDESDDKNEEPNWSVLRDDFMMSANLKDWNKKQEQEAEVEDPHPPSKRRKH